MAKDKEVFTNLCPITGKEETVIMYYNNRNYSGSDCTNKKCPHYSLLEDCRIVPKEYYREPL